MRRDGIEDFCQTIDGVENKKLQYLETLCQQAILSLTALWKILHPDFIGFTNFLFTFQYRVEYNEIQFAILPLFPSQVLQSFE